MTFNEHNINRETDGKFGAKVGGAPDISLSVPVSGTVQKQQWVGDYAVDIDDNEDEDLDMTAILDTQTLSSIKEMEDTGDRDWIYEEAQMAGLAKEHHGPFYVGINEDQLEQYIARRESLGQEEPLLAEVPLSQAKAREVTGKALAKARSAIPITMVINGSSTPVAVHRAYVEAAGHLKDLDGESLDLPDRIHVYAVRRFAQLTPGSDGFRERVLHGAAQLADYLLDRDEQLAAADKAEKNS